VPKSVIKVASFGIGIFFALNAQAGVMEDKSVTFDQRANAAKNTYGLVGSSDDAPIWNGVYVASQAHRFRVTHDPQALRQMEDALYGLVTLHDVTNIPGFFGRKIEPLIIGLNGAPVLQDGYQVGHGVWSKYAWKGKISHDQVVGYLYGLGEAWPYIQNSDLKTKVRNVATQIGQHFIDHKEKIQGPGTDLDFSPARIKIDFLPEALSFLTDAILPRGGKAMYALQLLKVVSVITNNSLFISYYKKLLDDKNYGALIRDYTQGFTEKIVEDNIGAIDFFARFQAGFVVRATPDSLRADIAQNLSHLALYSLSSLETDISYRKDFVEALKRSHFYVARHSNTFWNFLAVSQIENDPQGIIEGKNSLSVFPMDNYGLRSNSGDNSIPKYKGLSPNFFKGANWKWYSKLPLPFERRPMHSFAWQQNAFEMDGAYGSHDCPGVAYLAAYWMGRAYGYIGPHE